MKTLQPTVIDLFAGAGLFSYAFQREGFEIIQAVECDKIAAKTYAANVSPHIQIGRVEEICPIGSCDVLIAGPPCQGFSTLGKRYAEDPRNLLSLQVVSWARYCQPKIVVIENVAAFLDSDIWGSLVRRLKRLGYGVNAAVLNAHDFGVPQVRSRSFTIASQIGTLAVRPLKYRGAQTVREAWHGLPDHPDGHNHHYSPEPTTLAKTRMRLIPEGGDKRDVLRKSPQLSPPSWRKLGGQVTDAWGRMRWDEPANTLRTAFQNPSKGRYIHPNQDRVITLREGCRLHSIHDRWTFAGCPTQIARQIGNSVPPLLGQAVARAIKQKLS